MTHTKTLRYMLLPVSVWFAATIYGTQVTAPDAQLFQIGSDYLFTEGPATDDWGNIYFSDIETDTIYMWRPDGSITTYLTNTGGANGLFIDSDSNLIVCEGENGRITSIDPAGHVVILANHYNGLVFNQPNDLWVTLDGGIYFTDPTYGVSPVQDGEHVYYISPDHSGVIRVVDDLVRPNGIIGTPDGQRLYVTDHGAGQTFVYDITEDGTLIRKMLFVPVGGDGMTIDKAGNIYLAVSDGIVVYDSGGTQIEMIAVPDEPTNVTFAGPDHKTLFITARTSIYTIQMQVEGIRARDHNGNSNGNGNGNISIDQAISDEAQMKTIAFSGLAFLTGDMCSDTFFPPGKVSDFFGFQYCRDVAPNGFGHNTEFAGRVADFILGLLTADQVRALIELANKQNDTVDEYGYKRFVLIKAFRRLLENDLPENTTGLDLEAVMIFSADLYAIDAEISFERATVLGRIVATMTDNQKVELIQFKTDLDNLFQQTGAGGTINPQDWPSPMTRPDLSGLTDPESRILVNTYATQLYSWYLGSVYGDTYFCPERHGTYFGSFYLKDIPPLTSSEPVTIDTNLTADMGQAFLDTLDPHQAAQVTDLLKIQRSALNGIVAKRQEISEKLRPLMNGESIDQNEIVSLIREYGQYDGQIIYSYATHFVNVYQSLSSDQYDIFMGLRTGYYEQFPDYQANPAVYDCNGAWMYSDPLAEMPVIENTDFLFGSCSTQDDVSGDCIVNLLDFGILAENWMQTDCGLCQGADVTGDGHVDMNDLIILVENWL